MIEREPIIPSSQDKWLRLIDILQNELNLHVYPGGDSAMTGWHHRHAWIFRPTMERLYGTDVHKIPKELLEENWECKFYLYKSDWFPRNLGIDKIKTRGYKLKIPSLERALLEMVYDINKKTTIGSVFEYFTDLAQLNPEKIQTLLENCTSEKIKRFSLFLIEETCLDFYEEINKTNIVLNLKENLDVTNGHRAPNHVPKYNIEVPGNLEWGTCSYGRYYRTERTTRAV